MAIVSLCSVHGERSNGGGNNKNETCTTDDDCKGRKVCNLENNRCVKNNRNGTCTTNDDCKGSKVCNMENNRCVRCIEDSDCRTGNNNQNATIVEGGQMTGQFCFISKCKDTLPANATCIKDSWCTSGMCKDGECAEDKAGRGQYQG